ncbi:gastrin cholecystokinin type B receptor-like [Paramuricea clavata]|uniref:Gastrin cholecystokinin type B receptor-like n=1 Tax=Paramuricea clavata TaxID=317549 RepID=A0A6S7JGW7_PARCT|nr:gastrin cholecystokinin type B receptor-like [Paramuricea clavata]
MTPYMKLINYTGSNSNPPPVNLSRGEKLSFTLGYSVILLVGLSGNFLILIVIAANKEFHNNLNALLCNLVVADVLRMLTSVSFELFMINKIGNAVSAIPVDRGASGRIFCKSMFTLPPIFTFAFVFTLIFMTLERFVAVVFPFKSVVFKNKSKWIIAGVWFASIALEIPGLYAFDSIKAGGDHICAIDFSPHCDGNIIEDTKCNSKTLKDFLSVSVYITFVIAFLFILTQHIIIVVVLYKNRARFNPESSRVSRNPRNSTRDVVRMLGVVSVVYVITSLPSQIYQFGYIYDNTWLSKSMPVYFNFLLIFIENSHSILYPWIYPLFVKRFRAKYAKLVRGCVLRNKPRSQSDVSTKSSRATTITHDCVTNRLIHKNSNETKF